MSFKSSSAVSTIGNYESSNRYGSTNRSKETNLFIRDKETKSYNNIERDQYTKEKSSQKSRGSTSKDEFDEDFNPRAATTISGKYLG